VKTEYFTYKIFLLSVPFQYIENKTLRHTRTYIPLLNRGYQKQMRISFKLIFTITT